MQYRFSRMRSQNKDIAFAVMVGAILLGTVLGTVSFCLFPESMTEALASSARDYMSFRKGSDMAGILLNSFAVTSLFIASEFLLGFFALGMLPEVLVLIYRGCGLGIVLSQAYTGCSASERVIAALMIVPACVISCFALCLAAKEAVRLSGRLLVDLTAKENCRGELEYLKTYLVRFLALEAIAAVSAAVDCISSLLLADRF